jgi:hypothetical protein
LHFFSLLLCNIHKSSYNKSWLSSPHPSFSFVPLPLSWNSFNRYHVCIYIHVYTLFALYSSSHPFPLHLPHIQYFLDRVSRTICPDWLGTTVLLIIASRVAGITGASMNTWLLKVMWVANKLAFGMSV